MSLHSKNNNNMRRLWRCPFLFLCNQKNTFLLMFLVTRLTAFQQLRNPVPHSLTRRRCWAHNNIPSRNATTCEQDPSSCTAGGTAAVAVSDDAASTSSAIQEQTLRWVKRVVIGLQLCPFASPPLLAGRVHVRVVRGGTTGVLLALHNAMEHLQQQQEQQGSTTLVVCPDVFPHDFNAFWNEMVQPMETEWLVAQGWDGIFQVAPFHPLFQFAGATDENSPDQYTNRSPYPMLHILRESDVTRAVDELRYSSTKGDTEEEESKDPSYSVWSRNVDLLNTLAQELTPDEFSAVVTAQQRDDCLRAKVRSILQRFR